MKKKENIIEEDYGWFETDGMEAIDAMETMTGFLKAQHQSALELTKLTLEHCKIENLTKENILSLFQDAIDLMGKNIKHPMQ